MSKVINITQEYANSLVNEFRELLSAGKFSDGKINFTKTLGSVTRKATVRFSSDAWLKMFALVDHADKEIAWHGIAKRSDDADSDEYIISDILVYPQTVSGATVTTDQEKYETWLMSHDDDVFNNIRMQGHSHVNMSTSPSSVDNNFYDSIISQLRPDAFYIFMIWNKRREKTIKIYDMAKNIMFDTSDINVVIDGLDGWVEESMKFVKQFSYTTQSSFKTGFDTSNKSNPISKKDDILKKDNKKKRFKRKDKKEPEKIVSPENLYDDYYDDIYGDDWHSPFFSYGR